MYACVRCGGGMGVMCVWGCDVCMRCMYEVCDVCMRYVMYMYEAYI